jgi:hypothetical protein
VAIGVRRSALRIPDNLYQTCTDYHDGANGLPRTKRLSREQSRAANSHHGLNLEQDAQSARIDVAGTQ